MLGFLLISRRQLSLTALFHCASGVSVFAYGRTTKKNRSKKPLALRWLAGAGLFLVGNALACRPSAPAVTVVLLESPDTSLRSSLTSLEWRIVDTTTGLAVEEGSTTEPGNEAIRLTSLGRLEEGRSYVLELRGSAPTACAQGVAQGRSLPTVHQTQPYRFVLQFVCTEQWVVPPLAPLGSRVLHGAALQATGVAFVGGSDRSNYGRAVLGTASSADRIDLALGERRSIDELSEPRAYLATASTPKEGFAAAGGTLVGGSATCSEALDLFGGDSRQQTLSLSESSCEPVAVRLGDQNETWLILQDKARGYRYTTFPEGPGERFNLLGARQGASAVALGDRRSVLLAGNEITDSITPTLERVYADDSCAGGVCSEAVLSSATPATNWRSMSASYVPCPSGGGTVYLTGGFASLEDSDEEPQSLVQRGIWCAQDNGGPLQFDRVGELPEVRAMHRAIVLPSADANAARIAVIGGRGTLIGAGALLQDALFIDVRACACDEVSGSSMRRELMNTLGSPLLHTVTRLPDGSILVVGFVQESGSLQIDLVATDESRLFMPSTP